MIKTSPQLLSITAHQFYTKVMLLALSLHDLSSLYHSAEARVYQFNASPMKTEFRAQSSHYPSSLSSLPDAIHMLKLILYCIHFSCKDFSPGFPSVPSSASAHQLKIKDKYKDTIFILMILYNASIILLSFLMNNTC